VTHVATLRAGHC